MKNKYIQLTAFLLLLGMSVIAQESSVHTPGAYSTTLNNYIRSWDVVKPESNPNNITTTSTLQEARLTTQYFDGLGRPLQTVVKQGSLITNGSATDLVSPVLYDHLGREARKYLPYVASGTDGSFKTNPFTDQNTFYSGGSSPIYGQGETYYYGKTEFEASPMNRVDRTYAPGNSWVSGSGKGAKMKYWVNTATDAVRIWTVTDNGIGNWSTYGSTATYVAGELSKTVTQDENDKQVIEFKDKEGNIILKKVQLTASADGGGGADHTGWLCTYYLYDMYNQLRAMIQPEGVKALAAGGWTMNTDLYNEQCFRYEYDSKRRMIMKKVPGATGATEIVYDARDRVAMTRDANMAVNGQWLVTRYDDINRPIQTWMYVNSSSRATHQAAVGTTVDYPASLSGATLLTETYYDNYSWSGNPFGTTYNSSYNSYLESASNTTYPYAQSVTQSSMIKGLITGTKTLVLGTSTYLYTITFYDDKGRVIQVQATNLSGGTDISTTQYTWAGLPYVVINKQQKGGTTGAQTTVTVSKNTFDDLGRVVKTEKRIRNTNVNSDAISNYVTIADNEYDAVGQLKTKKLGRKKDGSGNYTSTPVETLMYDYNIRGWLLGANRDYARSTSSTTNYFGFDLGYDKTSLGSIGSYTGTGQFNGNIAGTVWKSKGDGNIRKYDFSYDNVNRLLKADFNQYVSGTTFDKSAGIDFSVKMGDGSDANSAYDYNGNIKQMQQWGLKGATSQQIDNLVYTYYTNNGITSNRLKNVVDNQNVPNTGLGDFRTSSTYLGNLGGTHTSSATDYAYDANGNLLKDLNKDIGTSSVNGITYNYLNLPQTITVTGKGSIDYVYDAAGNKLKKVVHESGKSDKVTEYVGGSVFIDNELQFIGQEEGRISYAAAVGSTPAKLSYDYFIKDHLGNVRMVLTEGERVDPYPAATLETNNLAAERLLYSKVDDGRVNKSTVSGYPADGYTSPNDFIQQLSDSGVKVGTGMLLKVMAGDAFNFRVSSWWNSISSPNTPVSPLTDLITAMSGSIGAVSNKFSTVELSGSGTLSSSITTFLNGRSYTTGKPKAYVQWMLLDEQLGYIAGSSGAQQVGASNSFTVHTGTNVSISKNGYLYIYVSNETPNINVFFDNLQVTHIHGAILEETHYYPFGLTMAGISSSALNFGKENKKKYNGIELQNDLGLNEYDAFFRELDPQTGRWWQIDPKIESMEAWSPYASNYDNPITYSDPLGDEPEDDDGGPGDGIINALSNIGRKAVMVAAGAINAWSSNQLLGAGRVDVNEMDGLSYGDKIAAKAGQTIGDVASIVTGLSEIGAGGAGSIASFGIASPVGVAVAAHGTSSIAMGITNLIKGGLNPVKKDESSSSGSSSGRSGKQEKLREIKNDPKASKADKGWIKQETNSIDRGDRKNIRVPPGKNLAHDRGKEASKGFSYKNSKLQDIDLHKNQHRVERRIKRKNNNNLED